MSITDYNSTFFSEILSICLWLSTSFLLVNILISLEKLFNITRKLCKSWKYIGKGIVRTWGKSNWWGDGRGSPDAEMGG